MTLELTTERLVLRPPVPEDVPAITRAVGNRNVARTLNPVPHPCSEQVVADWLAGLPKNTPEHANFAIHLPGTGLIGDIGLENEFGYWIAEEHWGQGYATEAGAAVLAWYFTNADADTVPSAAHIDNPASLAVQFKLGFVTCGRKTVYSAGRGRDVEHIETILTRKAFSQKGYLS